MIARVNGVAAGAGANIALACDIVVAAKSAKFIQSFSAIGLIPDSGGTWVLPRLVGQARALGLALTGEPLPAEKAAEWGLIWKAVDDEALDAEVDAHRRQARVAAAARPRRDQGDDPLVAGSTASTRSSSCRPGRCAASASPRIIAKASPPSSKSASRASPADDHLGASQVHLRRDSEDRDPFGPPGAARSIWGRRTSSRSACSCRRSSRSRNSRSFSTAISALRRSGRTCGPRSSTASSSSPSSAIRSTASFPIARS